MVIFNHPGYAKDYQPGNHLMNDVFSKLATNIRMQSWHRVRLNCFKESLKWSPLGYLQIREQAIDNNMGWLTCAKSCLNTIYLVLLMRKHF